MKAGTSNVHFWALGLSCEARPIGQGFLGSKMVRKGLGTKRFDPKKGQEAVSAKSGAGQKWSEKTKNMEKQIRKKTLSPSPKTK